MTLCTSLICSLVIAAEKDASEAIRSVVATLPNIHKLKPEQEQSLLSFVGGHDVVALLATGFGKSSIFQQVPLVVKELAKAYASDRLWQIRVVLGRSSSFKLQQSYPPSRKLTLVIERSQTPCTNQMNEGLVRTRLLKYWTVRQTFFLSRHSSTDIAS